MTKDDIIRMAQVCNLIGMRPHLDGIYQESLERFAALVAAAEREACAKVCEIMKPFGPELALQRATMEDCADHIRTRGQA
jgi:hypothetical protein